MGLFDAIKGRLGGGGQDEYADDDRYYEDEERYDGGYENAYDEHYADDTYYDAAARDPELASSRSTSVFNEYTPLVSMSDVRSQELPRLSPHLGSDGRHTTQAGTQQRIRTSLPYVGNANERLESSARGREERSYAQDDTGQLSRVEQRSSNVYSADDSSDPLLRRHTLSNTDDFSTSGPAYYASRSGVGHVRPVGQARRTHKFREAVVIRPIDYAESEGVASNLRRGNAVVLVLTQTRPELAKRILDFSFGAVAATEGQVVSIGERIYALTVDYPLTESELELLRARGIL